MSKKESCSICKVKVSGLLDRILHMQTHTPQQVTEANAKSVAQLRSVMEEIYPRRIG